MESICYRWPLAAIHGYSNDIDRLESLLAVQYQRWGMEERELGSVGDGMIVLWQSIAADSHLPHLLIMAGLHGDAPAGSWAILNFLQHNSPLLLDKVRLSFMPLVNLYGLRSGVKLNRHGFDPASGFSGDAPTAEGEILHAHARLLTQAARDGVLWCTEAPQAQVAWLCVSDPERTPALALRDELLQTFEPCDGPSPEGDTCRNGLAPLPGNGDILHWLSQETRCSAARAVTPGQAALEQRIFAHHGLIGAFIASTLAP
jgi:hypothetical protein